MAAVQLVDTLGRVEALITFAAIVAGAYFLWQKVRATPMAAELAASKEINETWRQTHEADQARISSLETELVAVRKELREAAQAVAHLQGQVEQLERFAAPEAVQRFEDQQEVIISILRELAHKGRP